MKERLIVLRTFKYREADLMVHGLNPQGARMSFVARAALKSKKRFAGGILEPTHYIQVHYRQQNSRDGDNPLHTLQEAELLKGFSGLRENYDRLEAGLHMVGAMDKVAQPGVPDSHELFDLLGNALTAAETSTAVELLRLHFDVKLLYYLGVLPSQGWYAVLLGQNLREHSQVQIQREDMRRFQNEVRLVFQRYLQGLSHLGEEALYI